MARLSQDFQAPQIRSSCRAPRCTCRHAVLAGSRATYFLRRLDGNAAILPRIVAIGDLDEDEIIFAEAATAELAEDALAVPPAIEPLQRRLLLTQLIVRWATAIGPEQGAPLIANTPAAALSLADDLARLIDDVITRKMDWQQLDRLVPDQFDNYWQFTLDFLKIARSYWPERLKEEGAIDAADRRDRLIDAEMRRLAGRNEPIIAAGSTGSMPATAKLLAAIARLPRGAVVLPGLDTDLDESSWRAIAGSESEKIAPAPVHPQFAMRALLERIGIARDAVQQLDASGTARPRTSGIGNTAASRNHRSMAKPFRHL